MAVDSSTGSEGVEISSIGSDVTTDLLITDGSLSRNNWICSSSSTTSNALSFERKPKEQFWAVKSESAGRESRIALRACKITSSSEP